MRQPVFPNFEDHITYSAKIKEKNDSDLPPLFSAFPRRSEILPMPLQLSEKNQQKH